MSPRSNRNTSTWSAVKFNKAHDLHDLYTGARDMITWYSSADYLIWQVSVDHNMMSYIKKEHGKPRLSLSTDYLEYGCHLARLHSRRRAYAPTSNTASHDNHEKINSWVSFTFLWVCMGLRLAAAGAPLKRCPLLCNLVLNVKFLDC